MTGDPTVAALDLFERARDLDELAQQRFLRDLCGSDAALFDRVSGMLRADARSHAFLDRALAPEVPRPALARLEGRQLGPYRIVRELGRGGMGVVYLAERDDVGRRVALKLITSHNASAEGNRAVPLRAPGARLARAPLHRALPRRRHRRGRDALARDGVRRRARPSSLVRGAGPAASRTGSRWSRRSARPWRTCTGTSSCTAT